MEQRAKAVLYQFPLSHYCEKARWALDYKGVPYELRNLIPGPHLLTVKRLAPQTSVPVLVHEGEVVQDSTEIIHYLDRKFPEKPLTPVSENEKKEAIELEEYFDQEAGVHLRRFLYHFVLEDRALASFLLLQDGPWYGKGLYAVAFPLLKRLMRKRMRINDESARRSQARLEEVLKNLSERVKKKEFLVGNSFTRADLAAASLLAPLCSPPEHDFTWPEVQAMPGPLAEFQKAHQADPFFDWVLKMYREHRR